MKHPTFYDLIDTTFDFPQEGIDIEGEHLLFNGINLYELVQIYGTPMRLFYLPKIGEQIRKARLWFTRAFRKYAYKGDYIYSYCTKSNHFIFTLKETLANGAHIEVSYTYDLDIVEYLASKGLLNPEEIIIIANGFKPPDYAMRIKQLFKAGFKNIIPVLDHVEELEYYEDLDTEEPMQIGIRIAAEEEPTFEFYTSRLGIRWDWIVPFYKERIAPNKKFKLVMLHFFINTGIRDSAYYWSEFSKALNMYIALRHLEPSLKYFNIGGGFPVRNSLGFKYDYEEIIDEIVSQIKTRTLAEHLPEPDIVSEFGTFTVGESGAHIFKVIGEKIQNDTETWYFIDNSVMTTLPDAWGMDQRFILLPVNKWFKPYKRVNIGGLSCDAYDYYNSEVHLNNVYLPVLDKEEPLYIAFLHTGHYQDALSGFGGIKHCLIPSPQYVVVDRDPVSGELKHSLFAEHQNSQSMLKVLGYV